MKSAISALCILGLIAALCFFSSSKINDICKETEKFVESLPESTEGVDPEKCQNAVDKWKKDSKFLSYFVSSCDISDITEALMTIRNSVVTSSDDEFAGAKARLVALLALMREAEHLEFDNIF